MENNYLDKIKEHLMNDYKPSIYLDEIIDNVPILEKEKNIEQSKVHHPEGNVWNHTMQVVDIAASLRKYANNKEEFMWAALLHDLGKIKTTRLRKGRITAYDHDKVGAEMVYDFFRDSDMNEEKVRSISRLVRWHMQVLFVVKDLPFADVKSMKEEVDLKDVLLLNLCDRLGRGKLSKEKLQEEKENILEFSRKIGANTPELQNIINELIK